MILPSQSMVSLCDSFRDAAYAITQSEWDVSSVFVCVLFPQVDLV
jgi:hypothetical protein